RRLGDLEGAVALLERAAARVPIAPDVHRRILDELVSIHELGGRPAEALRARRLRLTHLDDPRARAHEQRAIASFEESLGDLAAAVVALERAHELAPDDATLVHALDRLRGVTGGAVKRTELGSRFAAGAAQGAERARRLLRAADLAASHGETAKAVELARSAVVAEPSAAAVRARIAAHAHGAAHAPDVVRRVAHLEAIALLQEELVGDVASAAATYEAVLRADAFRGTALVGLARTAARAGDPARVLWALLEEADQTNDAPAADALRLRAAEVCAKDDPDRALGLVREVLARSPENANARRFETALHEEAGRWAQADASMAAAIEHALDERE